MAALRMHDLCGADPARRFSPYCWRARLALAHKGLEVETLPWRFTDKAAIADSGQDRVPVLRDEARVVSDSWRITEYLEDAYPDRPSLFGGPGGRALARFVNAWADVRCSSRRSPGWWWPTSCRIWGRRTAPTSSPAARSATASPSPRSSLDARRGSRRSARRRCSRCAWCCGNGPGRRRGRAGLCRLHRLRGLPVGALRQRLPAADAGGSAA